MYSTQFRHGMLGPDIILSYDLFTQIKCKYHGDINCCIEDSLSGSNVRLSELPLPQYEVLVRDNIVLNTRLNSANDTLEVFGDTYEITEHIDGLSVEIDGKYYSLDVRY